MATDGLLRKISEHSALTEVPFGLGAFVVPRSVGEKRYRENKKTSGKIPYFQLIFTRHKRNFEQSV